MTQRHQEKPLRKFDVFVERASMKVPYSKNVFWFDIPGVDKDLGIWAHIFQRLALRQTDETNSEQPHAKEHWIEGGC